MVMNNQKLRQQLEEAQSTNARLMEDVQHLTEGWNESREKLQKREALWQESFEHESGRSQKLHHFSLSLVKKDALVIKNEMENIQQNLQRYDCDILLPSVYSCYLATYRLSFLKISV